MTATAYRFLKWHILPEGEDREEWERAEDQYNDECKERYYEDKDKEAK